jgi:site-specific DNA recombinase
MRWAGYTRVSRVGDRGDKLISPELQADAIRGWARSRSVDVELLEPELNESGGRADRPILEQALAGVEGGIYAGIVVARLDRLSRSLPHSLTLFERVEEAGGEIVAVAEQIDSSTPAGRMQRNMLFTIGNFELDRYRESFREAKRSAVERCVWPVQTVPLGYVRGPDRILIRGPDAPKVRKAFEMRAGGASWNEIGKFLGRGPSGAARIIRNRVYLGEIRIGEYVNARAHEPIVSRALFEAAQLAHPAPPRGRRGASLLAGICRCAGCRRTMSIDGRGGQRYYRCRSTRSAGGRCAEPAIVTASIVEEYVTDIVLPYLEGVAYSPRERSAEVEKAERELAAAEAELEAFQEAVQAANVGAELVSAGLRSRAEAVEVARTALGHARSAPAIVAGDLLELWPRMNVVARRQVLRDALGVVWVRRGRMDVAGRVKIIASGSEPPDLPRPGRRFDPAPIAWLEELDGEVRAKDSAKATSGASA